MRDANGFTVALSVRRIFFTYRLLAVPQADVATYICVFCMSEGRQIVRRHRHREVGNLAVEHSEYWPASFRLPLRRIWSDCSMDHNLVKLN
jgi:hypothetical protein